MADLVGAPIEIAVVEFPGSRFNGEIVPALAHLVDDRIVTILDLLFVSREADGSVRSSSAISTTRKPARTTRSTAR